MFHLCHSTSALFCSNRCWICDICDISIFSCHESNSTWIICPKYIRYCIHGSGLSWYCHIWISYDCGNGTITVIIIITCYNNPISCFGTHQQGHITIIIIYRFTISIMTFAILIPHCSAYFDVIDIWIPLIIQTQTSNHMLDSCSRHTPVLVTTSIIIPMLLADDIIITSVHPLLQRKASRIIIYPTGYLAICLSQLVYASFIFMITVSCR
jgi:hypothetical protein